jgi:hypothetical protein
MVETTSEIPTSETLTSETTTSQTTTSNCRYDHRDDHKVTTEMLTAETTIVVLRTWVEAAGGRERFPIREG